MPQIDLDSAPITEQEKAVLSHLADAWDDFLILESEPGEKQEFLAAIHAAESIVGWIALARISRG